jgi:hypothetical protein
MAVLLQTGISVCLVVNMATVVEASDIAVNDLT